MRILACIATEHNILLVGLAALICSLGAWTSVGLLRRARARDGDTFKSWVFFGAVAAGSSVWCTHFVAMLAFEPQIPVSYEPGLTGLSLILAIFASALAFGVGSQRAPLAAELGGAMFGIGVAIMHYVGMAAFTVDAAVSWNSPYLTGSVLWAVALSALAFNRALATAPIWVNGGAACLFVTAVVGLHFTGMTAMEIVPFATSEQTTTDAEAREMLAFAVTAVALIVVAIVWVSHILDRQLRAQSFAQMRHLAGSSADGLLIEQDGTVIEANDAFEALSGFSRDELIGAPVQTAGFSGDKLNEGSIVRTTLTSKAGESIPVEIAAHTETGRPGESALRVYAFRDIRPRLEQERRIANLARNDLLTGLPNRAAFLEHLDQQIAACDETSSLALLAIDLNRFKEVNDLQGHAAGDIVLRVLAERMKVVLREREYLARLGGDEFMAVCRTSSRDDALDLATRLEKKLFSTIEIDEVEVVCGASIGIALYPDHATSATALMNNADLAMYRAKGSLTDNICFYAEEMDEAIRARRRMIGDLREALQREEFELRYQVQVDITTEEPIGYEALLRWRHPERGFVPPTEFIPLAEETGLIVPIGEWVLRTACREAATWASERTVAVNLSAVQLHQIDFPAVVHQILLETGLPAARLELETTETSLMKDPQRATHVMRQLKALGVSIAMDDFGTGYSSLSTLRAFDFDKIKLDKTFVDGIDDSAQARAVMLAVLALGNALSIPVLAEGVETKEQVDFLRSRGCNKVQGFFFGRPVAIVETTEPQMAVA
ncbi:EAL domain-containing protein [Hyphomicrobium sp. LHD-15]|uniref:bifunctional diguanylate cyclase/phosphodiesterase n=1 Tax=Hyphomicrobium sp. LHD-15 TaxID=3072142 RepID=UPI00281095DB|nr:EAL domain-containing protein [Hyphomicrobium sp. LHD-15]MDQ8697848.1 EAL domain-containing protein [Hyphomicrobium sp. LHD-15]